MDISSLNNLNPSEPVDLSAVAPKGPRFPRKGVYTLQLPETITLEDNFSETQSGNLAVEIDPVIVGPSSEGFQVRYVKASAKTYPTTDFKTKQKYTTSQMAELAASAGIHSFPGDPREQVEIICSLAGAQVRAQLDWRAKNKRTGEVIEGEENFPKNALGEPQPWIEDAEDQDPDGKNIRYRARIYVKRFYPSR